MSEKRKNPVGNTGNLVLFLNNDFDSLQSRWQTNGERDVTASANYDTGIQVFDNGMELDQRLDQMVRKKEVLWGRK